MPNNSVVTLLTDFDDFYVSAMKGVIASKTDADIIDIYHEVPPQDIRAGGFILANTAPYFPDGTVHCVVIDPGVGTERRAVVVEAGNQYFVGPDNGVLLPAARELGEPTVYNAPYDEEEVESNTFHGRDVFAPVAAEVAEDGFSFDEEIDDYEELVLGDPRIESGEVNADVIYVDRFGNVITNLRGNEILSKTDYGSYIAVNDAKVPFERTYGEVDEGKEVCTIGSHGNFEISVNQGSGSQMFGLDAGNKVEIRILDD